MAIAYGAITQPGLLSQQYPPPLLPKPGKDNVRLQKLLKRSAKKKASAQASQSAAPFRSSLSPVNEASPDLEHSDHSTPPKTPEAPFSLYNVHQPPRFTVRPLYQHVASPYPQRAAYGGTARFSPQTVTTPSYSYSQNVAAQSSYSASVHISGLSPTPEPVALPPVPKITLPPFPAPEPRVSAYGTYGDTHAGLQPVTAVGAPQPKPISPGPTPFQAMGTQAVIRPLTVLTPFKCKSPRPTFRATEPSRSPKPMFEVPQIRLYTASTSYYETSRTPPVYDTAGLTSIGSTAPQSKAETKQDEAQESEVTRGTTPTTQPPLLGSDPQRKTPTIEARRGATPTAEVITAVTPAPEIKRATPTLEIKRATPTSENRRSTPTAELKRATPTPETRVKTPTYEFQSRISAGRPRTPAFHTRAATPVFEVSRTNPLLFAVSPITVEPERSRTPKTVPLESGSSASLSAEPKPTETIPNGDILLDLKPAAKPVQQSITKAKSEPDLTRAKIPATPSGSLTPTPQPMTPAGTPYGYQRPKTPTFEASRLLSTSPGFKRPKTPTYGTSPSGVPPVAFQRPKTPTQAAHTTKSTYRGLTPAEYAAYGGIKTFTPAFGIASLGEVEASKEESAALEKPRQEPTTAEVSQVKETPKVVADKKPAAVPLVPVIIVSQASDSPGTQETSMVTSQVAANQERTVVQEAPKTSMVTSQVAAKQERTVIQEATKTSMVTSQVAAKQERTVIQEAPKTSMVTSQVTAKQERTVVQEATKTSMVTSQVTAKQERTVVQEAPKTSMVTSQVAAKQERTVVQEATKTSMVTSQVAAKQERTVIQEAPKAAPPTVEVKTPVMKKVEPAVPKVAKPSPKTPEVKRPPPKGDDQDPLKAVRTVLGKDKVQTAEKKPVSQIKADVPDKKEPMKPVPVAKPSTAAPSVPAKTGGEEKGKDQKTDDESLPAEPLLKVLQKPKGMKSKLSGWSRLKKHMVVEQEEPKFPEMSSEKETVKQDQSEGAKVEEKKPADKPADKAADKPADKPDSAQDENQTKDAPVAAKMWNAVLFQMFSTKENIMHQIELNKSEEEKEVVEKDESREIPSFAHRLPVLLFSPKFDAKKLKEAASRPVTKISTVFEMGLIGRKGKEEEPKDFNRTARGFTVI
ncbi:mucin-2 [Notolabrus celidotus]|uniref:mucin-2 n=1 Tax=Notolabrus celidotus TaxID=1203425 RepID=UPI00148FC248|nr:mucin-2 [Notolabrus celidotus]